MHESESHDARGTLRRDSKKCEKNLKMPANKSIDQYVSTQKALRRKIVKARAPAHLSSMIVRQVHEVGKLLESVSPEKMSEMLDSLPSVSENCLPGMGILPSNFLSLAICMSGNSYKLSPEQKLAAKAWQEEQIAKRNAKKTVKDQQVAGNMVEGPHS